MKFLFFTLITPFLLFSIHSDEQTNSPIEDLITTLKSEAYYEIALLEVINNSSYVKSDHQHKYYIIKQKDSIIRNDSTNQLVKLKFPYAKTTNWVKIDSELYTEHLNNLHHTIVIQNNGRSNRVKAPIGFNTYIGNKDFGKWKEGFWMFHKHYSYLNSLLFIKYPIKESVYKNYLTNYKDKRPYIRPSSPSTHGSRYSDARNRSSGYGK